MMVNAQGTPGGESPALAYEHHFVPAIGAPMAAELVRDAALSPGERVLDVACGTGVVARLAAPEVRPGGTVVGLDIDAGMLAVARSAAEPGASIEWHEASAEAMPLPDAAFDVVLCQMGLQFMPDQVAALREMRRVLARGGRLVFSVPGPVPRPLVVLQEALARHVGPEAARFVGRVFSLHDTGVVEDLARRAGFGEVHVEEETHDLHLPPPEAFLWGYVAATPLSRAMAHVDDERRAALARGVVAEWQEYVRDGALELQVRMVTAAARH